MNTRDRGIAGESAAAAYLQGKGFVIVERNYRTRYGEIDIIAKNDEFLLFVEVKTRKNAVFAAASEHVTSGKIRRVRTTAEIWLSERDGQELTPRFDVIEVYAPDGIKSGSEHIVHIENAF